MSGDGLVRPLNAPTGQPPAYGTQPGTTTGVIIASKVIIIGTGGEVLVYTPAQALGDLVASIAAAETTDAPGNDVLGGVTGYSNAAGHSYAASLGASGAIGTLRFFDAATQAGPWNLDGFIGATPGQMTISSSAGLVLETGGAAQSVTIGQSSGLTGGAPVTQLDRTVLAAGNNNTATDITNAWPIPAHDGDNGARYTIETFLTATTGNTTIETLTLGLDLNAGTLVPLATLGTAFNGGALATTYDIAVRLIVVPGAGTSAANAQIALSAVLGDTSANRLATNSAVMTGNSNTTAWDTTVANTFALYAQWGGTGGTGQSAGTRWSELTRSGQN